MANHGFGWLCGTHYASHLSDTDTAAFSAVMVMPWASTSEKWTANPAGIPPLSQEDCSTLLSEWLAPWQHDVEWRLYAVNSRNELRVINATGQVARPIEDVDAKEVGKRAAARLHAHVGASQHAMGFETGDDGRILTYPIVGGGVSQVPAAISESVLCTARVFLVARMELGAGDSVVALPTFKINAETIAPAESGHAASEDPVAIEFKYTGASKRTVAGHDYDFSACVSSTVTPTPGPGGYHGTGEHFEPRRVEIRNGKSTRQVYAALSRGFHPLKLWLAAMDDLRVAALGIDNFREKLSGFLGSGEDELDATGAVVGSIYELVLSGADYKKLVAPLGAKPADAAQRLLELFRTFTANPNHVVMLFDTTARIAHRLGAQSAGDAAAALARLPDANVGAAENIARALSEARALADALAASEPIARALWAGWLAAVLQHVISTAAPGSADLAKAALEVAESMVARSQEALRNEAATAPVLEDDVLRVMNGQIDYAPTFWSQVHGATDPAAGLAASAERKQLLDSIQNRGWGLPVPETAKLRAALEEAYDAALDEIRSLLRQDQAEGDDPALQLRYAANGHGEKEIRGCILAMRVGIHKDDVSLDWQEPAWISTFRGEHPGQPGVRIRDGAGDATFVDTVGATASDALEEQEVVYDGQPLFAAERLDTAAAGKGPELLVPVPPDKAPAGLALGMSYQVISGTVDNAGAILEKDLRDGAYLGSPGPLAAAFFEKLAVDAAGTKLPTFRLLSRQPPGAPVLGPTEDHGVGPQTFAAEVLLPHLKETQAARVAVVYSGEGYAVSSGRHQQVVKLRAPTVGPVFAERWLNADALLPADDRWEAVKKLDREAILRLIRDAKALPSVDAKGEEKKRRQGITHPAVRDIGIRVTWYGNDTAELDKGDPITVSLRHLAASGEWLRDESVDISIEQADSDGKNICEASGDAATIHLRIRRGFRARVELLSVIPARYVDEGRGSRFNKSSLAGPDGPYEAAQDAQGNKTYITRNPPSFWVESLQEVSSAARFKLPGDALELVYPVASDDPPAMTLRLKKGATVDAASIIGFALEQKRWQWPGYPVAFPRKDDLEHWLPLYVGTEDSMPELPAGSFTSQFSSGGWHLKAAVMRPVPLPGRRGANHMGLIVTPIPRFASLLKNAPTGNLDSRCIPVHLFATVHATPRDPSTRLQPPVWMEAIPLPHSKQVDGNGHPVAAPPGNLAVFRDPVHDTADTSVLGGIAEKLELDVPSTWEQRLEAGVNPIFHGAPQANEAAPWVTLDLPFGLTYDRVVGGRPAQTAAVMRVHNAKGRWVLAKCRVRRIVDPELVAGSELVSAAKLATLALRRVEDGWIPEDVAVYCTTPMAHLDFGTGHRVDLPAFTSAFDAVYLVTWHRDRWGQAEPTWRPLVKVYRTDPATHTWHPLATKNGRTVGSLDFTPLGPGSIQLTLSTAATVRRLEASDYTESRWLTFIGSFGLEKPAATAGLQLARYLDGFRLAKGAAPELPRLRKAGSPSSSILLLFAPRRDLMRGELDKDGGELVGVYAMRKDLPGDATHADFDVPLLKMRGDGPYKAVVIQLQRHHVDSDKGWTMDEGKWPQMVNMMFPPQSDDAGVGGDEASLRLLPEFIGEFDVS